MCFNPRPFEPIRLEFYLARLFSGQDIRGINTGYFKLKQAFQIAIISNERFFGDNEFFHSFEYYDELRHVSLKGKSRIITLELSKLKSKVLKLAIEMSIHERWAVYLEYMTDKSKRSKINEILNYEEGIAMANGVLFEISRDEIERAKIMRAEKTELDYISYMAYAKEEGHAEGHKKGREEIINLLKSGKLPEEILREYS